MMVSGASPAYAGIYQFVVAMILAASGIAGLVATVPMRRHAFSAAAQLTLRPRDRRPRKRCCEVCLERIPFLRNRDAL